MGQKIGGIAVEDLQKQTRLTPDQEESVQKEGFDKANETPEQKTEREKTEAAESAKQAKEQLSVKAKGLGLKEDATEDEIKAKEEETRKTLDDRAEKAGLEKGAAQADIEKAEKAKEGDAGKVDEGKKADADKVDKDYVALIVQQDSTDEIPVSEDEAREVLTKEKAIAEKYGIAYTKENRAMIKAYRNMQQFATKVLEEAKQGKQVGDDGKEYLVINGKQVPLEEAKADLVENYRERFPILTKEKEDDEVFEMAQRDLMVHAQVKDEQDRMRHKSDAAEKRKSFVANLPEKAKPYLNDIKVILEKSSDAQILGPNFDIKDVINWAMGKNVDQMLDAAEKRGIEKGKEQAKILGEVGKGTEASKGTDSGGKATKYSNQLTTDEKERALSMYDHLKELSDEDKFKMFIDYKDHDKKLDEGKKK